MIRGLGRARRVAIDTSLFIYLIEDHADFGDAAAQLFTAVEKGELDAVTSSLTILEVLVHPYRVKDAELTGQYYALFSRFPHLHLRDLDVSTADRAAQLRAAYGLKTPDAIQVATALQWGAEVFVTNDRDLRRVRELRVVTLSDDWSRAT